MQRTEYTMAQLGRIVKCTRCLKEQSIDNVRYADDGKFIICLDCYAKLHPERLKTSVKTPVLPPKVGEQKKPSDNQFRCTHCNYRFKSKKDITAVPQCPYCGKTDIKLEKTHEIHQL